MDCTSDNLPDDSDQIIHGKHGTSFTIQDENSPVVTAKPPRRLQALKGTRPLTIEELLKEQREHTEKREQRLREQKDKLSNRRRSSKSLREFEEAQRLFTESEKKAERVLRKKEEIINEKVTKVRKHNSKVVARKRQSTLRDSLNDNLNLSGKMEHDGEYNKSESESWADNDSIKNIYDQMDYIKPVSGLAHAVTNNANHSDDEFFS